MLFVLCSIHYKFERTFASVHIHSIPDDHLYVLEDVRRKRMNRGSGRRGRGMEGMCARFTDHRMWVSLAVRVITDIGVDPSRLENAFDMADAFIDVL